MNLLFLIAVCRAAQMEFEEDIVPLVDHQVGLNDSSSEVASDDAVLAAPAVVALALPAIAPRADFEDNLPSYQGFQYLQLKDFETGDKRKYRLAQADAAWPTFVAEQLEIIRKFPNAGTPEEKMSLILDSFAKMAVFLHSFNGRLGADEKYVLLMYLFAQGVARTPAFLASVKAFSAEFDTLEANNFSAVNFRRITVPSTFRGAEREADTYIEIVRIHLVVGLCGIPHVMNNYHVGVLNEYRQRVVEEAQELAVPNNLINAASNAANWEQELLVLANSNFGIFGISRVFHPVRTTQDVDRDVALQSMVWFLVNPNHAREAELNEFLMDANAMTVSAYDQAARQQLLQLFVDQALRIAVADEGKFLAGLMYAIWMTKGQNLARMWNRNLYKRSFKRWAIISWRQWFQEELLSKRNDDLATKEIVKSTVESVTGILRDAPKKTWSATNISNALLAYFNN
jgi:hypothetical protein